MATQSDSKRRKRPESCVSNLGVGDKIQVRFMKDVENTTFETRVDDFSDRTLYVSFPDAKQKLRYGERVECTFTRDQGLYKFDGILDTGIHSGRQSLTIRVLSGARLTQRRTAVRVPVRLNLDIAVINRPIEDPVDIDALEWEESVSDNFSFSGILTRATPSCVVGDLLALRFDREQLPMAPEFMLASWRRLHRMGSVNYVGLEFISRRSMKSYLMPEEILLIPEELKKLSEMIANKLSAYVFEYELKMRQEGRL